MQTRRARARLKAMLKKISTDQLRLGMHVHEVCGSWMDHPFWKSSFRLKSEEQLQQLQKSAVRQVVIDTDKGDDLPPLAGVAAAVASEPLPEPQASLVSLPAKAALPTPVSMQEEMQRANRIVSEAKGAMKTMFEDMRLGKAVDAEHCLPLVEEITQSVARNPGAIVSLARLKTSDDYTYMHCVAVCALMVSLARQLNLDDDDVREAGLAGLVHDLGKSAMPIDVLNKPGKLTAEEFAIMRKHPEAGHRLLLEAKGVGEVPLDVCLHHHEKVSGNGYPHRLKGDEISVFARMGAVCDVYDAITSNRPYKAGWDPSESVQRMAQWAREGQFEESIFQAFVRSIGIYPTGSLVKMASGRLAVVVEQGSQSLLHPVVRAFYSTKSKEPITPELIDTARSTDQIVSRESPTQWGFARLDELWKAPG
jgi:HD-GYP domain-containing protein (c-di-GMP phosphodiesterase class II)